MAASKHERETYKQDAKRGLFRKYHVERIDGRSAPGEKHDGCEYFVLDLTHDPHALIALRAYEVSVRSTYPILAGDIRAAIRRIERGGLL